jgi:prolipoprotein diacylglyceryl transferase
MSQFADKRVRLAEVVPAGLRWERLRAGGNMQERSCAVFVWDVSPVLLTLGPIQVRYYGLLFALMLIGGYYIWQWQMLRGGHTQAEAEGFFLWGAVAVIAGARLGQVLFYDPKRYLANPIEILYVWKGGLASHGATLGLVLVLILYARHLNLSRLEILDRFSMSAALGALMVRIGNFMNSEIVGRVTDVPWAVKFPRCIYDKHLPLDRVPARHPSQIYEVFLGLFVLLSLYLVDRKYKEERPLGLLAWLFFILYFSGRFVVEFFKEYQALSPDKSLLTMGQWLSIPFVLIGLYGLVRTYRAPLPTSSLRPAPGNKEAVKKDRKKGKGKGKTKK